MEIILHREDLLPDRKDKACSATCFADFGETTQNAIKLAGSALFKQGDGGPNETYNRIYPPKKGTHDLRTAVQRVSDALRLDLELDSSRSSLCSDGVHYYKAMSPTGIEMMEILFDHQERGWAIGGVGWTFDFNAMSRNLFGD